MTKRLLDRQAKLLDYLSSGAAMFGAQADAPADPALRAFDPALLRLQARYICNKRLEKIITVFPRTLQILGAGQRSILREFVEASRSTKKSTLANAREFHEFLAHRWQRARPEPAYLPDVAACELAMVEAGDVAEDRAALQKDAKSARARRAIRRRRNVVPLRCAHDVRAIFDAGSADVVPPRRAVSLIVTAPAGSGEARIVEATSRVVEALSLLGDWTHPSALDGCGDRENLVAELAANEFIEIRA
jgi:hypothetical protein